MMTFLGIWQHRLALSITIYPAFFLSRILTSPTDPDPIALLLFDVEVQLDPITPPVLQQVPKLTSQGIDYDAAVSILALENVGAAGFGVERNLRALDLFEADILRVCGVQLEGDVPFETIGRASVEPSPVVSVVHRQFFDREGWSEWR